MFVLFLNILFFKTIHNDTLTLMTATLNHVPPIVDKNPKYDNSGSCLDALWFGCLRCFLTCPPLAPDTPLLLSVNTITNKIYHKYFYTATFCGKLHSAWQYQFNHNIFQSKTNHIVYCCWMFSFALRNALFSTGQMRIFCFSRIS